MPPPEDAVSFCEESRPRWKGTEHLVLGLGSTPSIEHPDSVTATQDVTNFLLSVDNSVALCQVKKERGAAARPTGTGAPRSPEM
jgi:hypothetical protein